jgi:putative hydrolase of the HAD superfamily
MQAEAQPLNYHLPPVLFLDLDDTIIVFDAVSEPAWVTACAEASHSNKTFIPEALMTAIKAEASWFWSDPERHRQGRLKLDETRLMLVNAALEKLGVKDIALAESISHRYITLREESMHLFPGAFDALEKLSSKTRLALITNGESHKQRGKINRFNLERFFERIYVEEEVGFGKPDVRVYQKALSDFTITAEQAWMVGDNLEWDVAAPQSIGIRGIWHDWRGKGLPEKSAVIPDRIIHSLAELIS